MFSLYHVAIKSLITEIEAIQEEFKNTHKQIDGMKQSGPNATQIKKEIQQMEEEKQQILSKISKLQKRVQNIPKSDQWLQAGKNLRLEQMNDFEIEDRIREQRSQLAMIDKKLTQVNDSLKAVKDNLAATNADAVFSKLEEEHRMNKFLATINLPKALNDAELKVRDLTDIIGRESINDEDIARIEKEISETNQINSQLSEQKMKMSNTGDANLALFRQQASIIAAKKEGTLAKLTAMTSELNEIQSQIKNKQSNPGANSKMLVGDEFKKYVSELRGKSTNYKRKKAELSSISTELGILQRTKEVSFWQNLRNRS